MSRQRYTEEFKIAAVRQVTVNGHGMLDVAKRFGITMKSLWIVAAGNHGGGAVVK